MAMLIGCGGSTDDTGSTVEDSAAVDSTTDSAVIDSSVADTGALDTSTADTTVVEASDSGAADSATSTDSGHADTGAAIDSSDSGSVDSSADADASTDTAVDATSDVAFDAAVDAVPDVSTDVSETGPTCTGDLSGIGTGDFRIAFRITTSSTVSEAAVINQRAICGFSVFWDIRMASGKLIVETDGGGSGADYSTFSSTGTVNDGAPHDVVLTRTSGVLRLTIDGIADGTTPSISSFSTLAPLQTKTDVCTGTDGTVALVGTVSNVCVSH